MNARQKKKKKLCKQQIVRPGKPGLEETTKVNGDNITQG